MSQTHLHFDMYIGRQKPESINNREAACPFCNRAELTDILDERGEIIWLKNKYPVLQDASQTVLIETDQCDSDLSEYSKEHLYALFSFGMEKWLEMAASGSYRSVLFFKNHGPYSGGSIRHPHMQIVGLDHFDYLQDVKREDFEGIVIDRAEGVECNLSTKPRVGFFEYNVILSENGSLHRFADYTQILTHWILHHVNRRCQSYNLFFYQWEGRVIVKVVPRFVASPLYIGYGIPQVGNNLEDVVRELRRHYF
ncbi:DUF4931 domain-containing protein [Brevibacillus ruminantium]|uniref:DUF4931 domain-containing protein n=1 Tax=Brevibacillus ruminantium TaxID=2950604 RepID=A0ABY4WDC5_9BACL|nr:DUF4931 domain-containing protein [Brevibacillus ruminantium]USG63932.1 DUF4931 domain-containing protein [Brevibacillus ruminantium]